MLLIPSQGTLTTPAAAKAVVAAVNEFVQSSPLPAYDQVSRTGVWRMVTVRVSERTGQLMVMLETLPPGSERETDMATYKSELARATRLFSEPLRMPAPIPCPVPSSHEEEDEEEEEEEANDKDNGSAFARAIQRAQSRFDATADLSSEELARAWLVRPGEGANSLEQSLRGVRLPGVEWGASVDPPSAHVTVTSLFLMVRFSPDYFFHGMSLWLCLA